MKQQTSSTRGRRAIGRGLVGLALVAALTMPVGCSAFGIFAKNPTARSLVAMGFPEPQAAVIPPTGLLYNHQKAPITNNFEATPMKTSKHGTATTFSVGIPYFFGGLLRAAWGDGSVDSAKAAGGITDMKYAEYETTNYLSVFTKFTIHVYGE